jgi:osmoprotectant transport system substrate-binding protein
MGSFDWLTRRRASALLAPRRAVFAAALMACCAAAGMPSTAAAAQGGVAPEVRIGGKNFTEQYVLAAITAQYLQAHGYAVDVKAGLGSTLMRSAQENGQLDIVWEYTGTALIVYNKISDKLDPKTTYERVKRLDAARGLIWLDAARLNNTYALAMPREQARRTGIRTISQLAAKMRSDAPGTRHVFAMDAEFANRPDGLHPLADLYGLQFTRADIKQMDPGLVYTALHNNQVMIGLVYTTDGRVKGFDVQVLADDKGFFPAYNATPVVRKATLDQNPGLAGLLDALSALLTNDSMLEMNKQVDIDGKSVQQVAASFLQQHKAELKLP